MEYQQQTPLSPLPHKKNIPRDFLLSKPWQKTLYPSSSNSLNSNCCNGFLGNISVTATISGRTFKEFNKSFSSCLLLISPSEFVYKIVKSL